MLDKKGFLFTVTVFLVLMYVLLSISVWVKAIESSERAFSEFYKESTVELTIEQITPEKMNDTAHIIMNRNLMRLNTQAEEFPVKAGPPEDEGNYTRAVLLELLANGSAPEEYFDGGAPALAEEESSFKAWKTDLDSSLKAIGVYVSRFNISGFQVGQAAMDKVNYTFNITLELKDFMNTSSVSRTYEISDMVSITGFVDPALARESRLNAGDNDTVYRQFFFDKTHYADAGSASVSKIAQSVTGGQGWLYAPLASASDSAAGVPDFVPLGKYMAPSERSDYVLAGTFDEITAIQYTDFAGYILTNAPVTAPTSCGADKVDESKTFNPISYSEDCKIGTDASAGDVVAKPFIVAPGFNLSKAPECPLLGNTSETRRCVLMVSSYSEAEVGSDPSKKNAATADRGLYDLEDIRTFVMCGFYTNNPNAPSYLQRLLPGPYARNSTDYGIETFVIGNYASDYGVYDTHSRLDRELFNDVTAIKVRGLPGCKSLGACSDSPITGIFAVNESTKADYGLDHISCDNGAAGCGE